MTILKRFKKKKQEENVYEKMARLGVSPSYMLMYQDSVKKIKEFEKQNS